ncbi:hypothetical protein EF294_15320 [Gordonia oryzae]|uniref:Uncharacterized protein n=1 Tax=Gordonia oryzae TaxID=2487349 RepID=A0A3N4GAX5_9ACTN|nr:hypothetical protein [Gordonia oryzae]RPA58537.1 hypothetical protein EF294_15320 [Gordonia oryzae]
MTGPIEQGFVDVGIPRELIDELVEAYSEAKRRYRLGDLRPSAVEGGRFSEAAFRILEWESKGSYTPLGTTLSKVPTLVNQLESCTSSSDSIRFHIPRTLRAIYDIRNKRNIAHLADGIDPNTQDGTFVIGVLDWVMAELVRLFHSVEAAEAQRLIEALVSKEVPALQIIEERPVFLTKLTAGQRVLVVLYWQSPSFVTRHQLRDWLPESDRRNLGTNLGRLEGSRFIHRIDDRIYLTELGIKEVEAKDLLAPAD